MNPSSHATALAHAPATRDPHSVLNTLPLGSAAPGGGEASEHVELVGGAGPGVHQAASEGRLKRGDVVLLYSIGSIANASAALFRWGDVAVG